MKFSLMTFVCTGFVSNCAQDLKVRKPRDCQDVKDAGFTESGMYNVTLVGTFSALEVYCDIQTDEGGWLVFQRREDGSEKFFRGWDEYELGFGKSSKEQWLGNLWVHIITNQGHYELRVDLEDWEGHTAFAKYTNFWIAGPEDLYRLTVSGYSGNAGDALSYHSGSAFSTVDRDNDSNDQSHCAQRYKGPWWHKTCHFANLNGFYHGAVGSPKKDGVNWQQWRGYNYSLKATEMKIRRL